MFTHASRLSEGEVRRVGGDRVGTGEQGARAEEEARGGSSCGCDRVVGSSYRDH